MTAQIGLSAPHRFELGKIHPGKVYDVGVMTIRNVGDEKGCFEMGVTWLQSQPELKIPKEWVTFEPANACFEGGENVVVKVKLKVKKPKKGDYFCYLEACMRGCVATKLYFTLNSGKK